LIVSEARRTRRNRASLFLAALLVAAAVETAAAQSTDGSGGTAAAIGAELDAEAARARLWWNAWTAGYAGLTIGQGVAAGRSGDRDTRADLGVGAATSLIGVAGMLLSPLPRVAAAAEELETMPSGTAEERQARDRAAVLLRERAADAEREGRSWLSHALNFVVAAGSSLVLWKGFDRGTSAAESFATGLAVGELQLWTQPSHLATTPAPIAGGRDPARTEGSGRPIALGWTGRSFYVRWTF
jgi:hypothetical protein